MYYKRIIKLSFNDKGVRVKRRGLTTTVKMVSYFREDYLRKFLGELGFVEIPSLITDALKKYGYTYDYKLHGWKITLSGDATLDERDVDDQKAANRVATTRAKYHSYKHAERFMNYVVTSLEKIVAMFGDSRISLEKFVEDEGVALNRVIETGYCNPDKQ